MCPIEEFRNEFRDILYWAFRYALGRKSYVVGHMVKYLIRYEDTITPLTKEHIIRDIKKAAGVDMEWETIVKRWK